MNRVLLLSSGMLVLVAACDARSVAEIDSGVSLMGDDSGSPPEVPDAGTPPASGRAPGRTCDCDTECSGSAQNPGLCVEGICMTRASAACASAGSSGECPAGSRCWGYEGVTGGICWPDCDAHACEGACDSDGSCVPSEGSTCTASCAEVCDDGGGGDCPPNSHAEGEGCACDEGFTVNEARDACVRACTESTECTGGQVCVSGRCVAPPCTATSCPSGTVCAASGSCVIDIGSPPSGPPPACAAGTGSVPDWRCTSGCGDLVPFEPTTGPGYWNYPLNGETEANQYRSFIRRDVMMLVKYASAMVACQTAGWTFGNGGLLGLGDMSEADGSIPGTSIGSPGHPAGTHVDGHDMDIAYYQVGTADNRLRAVCEHSSGGSDAYHCTSDPTLLDPWRTALFLGHLHVSPQLRVIGVDGRVGPLVDSALRQLCSGGWVSTTACSRHSITWEATDAGRGWYYFHHHHLHISVSSP